MYYTTKAAVAGAGFIGPVHVEALKRLGITVTGIAGSTQEEAEQAQQALSLPRAYRNFEEMLEDEEVDVVHLAVPNRLHFEFSKKALQAGKHVLCEKPLAMNSNESEELVELAKKSGLHAGVCYNIRFYPLNLEARSRIREQSDTEVYSITGSYVQDWLLYDTDYNWRVLASEGGPLRAVADIGTHWMDLVSSITGLEIESVLADLQTVHPVRKRPVGEVKTFSGDQEEQELEPIDIDTEDAGAILLRFSNGAKGVLWVSQTTAGRKNTLRYEIATSDRSYAWNSEHPNELWIGRRGSASELLARDPATLSPLAAGFSNYPGGHNEGFPDAFKQCFRAFYNAVDGKTDKILYPTFAEGHREVLVCEAILKSHKDKQWVVV